MVGATDVNMGLVVGGVEGEGLDWGLGGEFAGGVEDADGDFASDR